MSVNKFCDHLRTVCVFLLAFGIGIGLTLRADPLVITEHYAWSVRGDEESPIDRSTDLRLKLQDGIYQILIGSIWIPGAVVDIQAETHASDVVLEETANGTMIYTLNFQFQDSFENGGTGKVVITNNQALVTLTVESRNVDAEISHRATRQYDGESFQLVKSRE